MAVEPDLGILHGARPKIIKSGAGAQFRMSDWSWSHGHIRGTSNSRSLPR